MRDRILIIGSGAVGGYVGAHLTAHGHDVIFCDPWPEHVNAMNQNGLRIEGQTKAECFQTPVRALHITDMQMLARERPADIVFICVKSYDTAWAAALAREYMTLRSFSVSLQNGINEEALAEMVGWGRTVGCIASKIVVELVAPAFIRRSVSKGGEKHVVFRMGEIHGRVTPRLERLCALLEPIDSAKTTNNLWGERWSKLVANAMANGLCAASGLSAKQYILNESTRRLSIRLAAEAIQVGVANGYALEPINGFAPEKWIMAAEELISNSNRKPNMDQLESGLLAAAEKISDTARPSMGQDIIKGRRTEIEHLNGLVIREGEKMGLQATANKNLVDAVQLVESNHHRPSLDLVANI